MAKGWAVLPVALEAVPPLFRQLRPPQRRRGAVSVQLDLHLGVGARAPHVAGVHQHGVSHHQVAGSLQTKPGLGPTRPWQV